jgi:hypothetical protein
VVTKFEKIPAIQIFEIKGFFQTSSVLLSHFVHFARIGNSTVSDKGPIDDLKPQNTVWRVVDAKFLIFILPRSGRMLGNVQIKEEY